jgi:hypothetical protein
MVFEHLQQTAILRAIGDMQLEEREKPTGVNMSFNFFPERLPADLRTTPTAGLRKIYEAVAAIVYPETGAKAAIEWTLEMGTMQLDLKFSEDHAEAARDAWPQVKKLIGNIQTQHLRN